MTVERLTLECLRDFRVPVYGATTLFSEVNIRHHEAVTRTELLGALSRLEAMDPPQVAALKTDDGTKWLITDAGRARLLN
jgi:hypothetical protein